MSSSRTEQTAIASRYATAIFALATDAKKAPAVVEQLSAVAAAISGSKELADALKSPLVNREAKGGILASLAGKAEKITLQSLATLAEQGRADVLPAIAAILRKKLAEAQGELIAEVESARPLSAAVQKQLTAALSKATGKDVKLDVKENPALLGGVAIQIGSQRLDASLSAALNTMRQQLLASNR